MLLLWFMRSKHFFQPLVFFFVPNGSILQPFTSFHGRLISNCITWIEIISSHSWNFLVGERFSKEQFVLLLFVLQRRCSVLINPPSCVLCQRIKHCWQLLNSPFLSTTPICCSLVLGVYVTFHPFLNSALRHKMVVFMEPSSLSGCWRNLCWHLRNLSSGWRRRNGSSFYGLDEELCQKCQVNGNSGGLPLPRGTAERS